MKKENGLGITLMIIITFAIILIGVWGIKLFIDFRANLKENSVKSDMLLIQGACKVNYETNVMNKTPEELIGTKLSETDANEQISKSIIDAFKALNIVKEKDYDKYYVLTNEDLEKLKLEVTNHEESYYIVGYEKGDVIISKGYEGKYRLAELNNEPIPVDDEEENTTEEESSEAAESDEENKEEEDE